MCPERDAVCIEGNGLSPQILYERLLEGRKTPVGLISHTHSQTTRIKLRATLESASSPLVGKFDREDQSLPFGHLLLSP